MLKLDQATYIEKLLREYGMENTKSAPTLIVSMNIDTATDNIKPEINFSYRELVGSLQYLSNKNTPRHRVHC